MRYLNAFLSAVLCLVPFTMQADDDKIPHLTAEIVEIGKVMPRTQLAGAQGERYPQEYVMNLNGEWDFWWSESDASFEKNFLLPEFNSSNWDKIQVPANWELNGYGVAIYTNHGYEFVRSQCCRRCLHRRSFHE